VHRRAEEINETAKQWVRHCGLKLVFDHAEVVKCDIADIARRGWHGRKVPFSDSSRTGSAADQIRVCSQTLKSAKAVVVARLQRHHPHPEHCLVADIDIVLARERQLAVIANTEHRQARGYWLYRIAIPHIHRQIVLRHQ
jgi:hypothetical protein